MVRCTSLAALAESWVPVPDIKKKDLRPCGHMHVSGRRCSILTEKRKEPQSRNKYRLCELHILGQCSECHSMMAAFTPKKGWGPRSVQ